MPASSRLLARAALALVLLGGSTARADAPAPSLALPSDRVDAPPRGAISIEAGEAWASDASIRVEFALDAVWSAWGGGGLSRRHGGDALSISLGVALWPLARALEGLWLGVGADLAWAGPWGPAGIASVARANVDAGWAFRVDGVLVALGGGAAAAASLDALASPWPEARMRCAVGLVWP